MDWTGTLATVKSCAVPLVVVSVLATSASATPVLYTFDLTRGNLGIAFGMTPNWYEFDGTFAAVIESDDGHIGESDWVTPTDCSIVSTEDITFLLMGTTTVTIAAGNAGLLDFAPEPASRSAHIGPGGVGELTTDAYVGAIMVLTGSIEDTYTFLGWAGQDVVLDMTVSTSVAGSDILTIGLSGWFTYVLDIPEVGHTFDMYVLVDIEGTAHVVPEPALAGLTSLGVGAAGVWLRRRTS
jgi:hypothetical protein